MKRRSPASRPARPHPPQRRRRNPPPTSRREDRDQRALGSYTKLLQAHNQWRRRRECGRDRGRRRGARASRRSRKMRYRGRLSLRGKDPTVGAFYCNMVANVVKPRHFGLTNRSKREGPIANIQSSPDFSGRYRGDVSIATSRRCAPTVADAQRVRRRRQ